MHILIVNNILVISALCRVQVDNISIVSVLSLAPSTERLEVKEACELEVKTQLNTIVVLLHVSHANICERVSIIKVEVLPLSHVCHVVVVATEVSTEPTTRVLIAKFA